MNWDGNSKTIADTGPSQPAREREILESLHMQADVIQVLDKNSSELSERLDEAINVRDGNKECLNSAEEVRAVKCSLSIRIDDHTKRIAQINEKLLFILNYLEL
jgi:hypothetical protein